MEPFTTVKEFEERMNKGIELYKEEKYEEALVYFLVCIPCYPVEKKFHYKFASAYAYVGMIHYDMKNWDKAARNLRKYFDISLKKDIYQ